MLKLLLLQLVGCEAAFQVFQLEREPGNDITSNLMVFQFATGTPEGFPHCCAQLFLAVPVDNRILLFTLFI